MNMTEKNNSILVHLKEIWNGTATKTEYGWHLLITYAVYFFGIIYGAAVYDGGFSMDNVYVSYLGSQEHDPTGFLVYDSTVLIAGIMLIPYFIYIYRCLRPTFKVFNILSCFFGLVGAVGFAGLSIFHQDVGQSHMWFTDIAFGGLGVSAFFMLWVFCKKLILNQPWPKIWQIVVVYGLILGIIALINIISTNGHFQEWFYTLIMMIWVIGIYWVTPKDQDKISA
jgi:hypothetical protein